MKRVFVLTSVLVFTLCFSSCACEHDWWDATCTTPKTCSLCGETSGTAVGHQWEDATCATPKTCSVCGLSEGDVSAHEWVAATCTEAKTCFVCKTAEGESLGHKWEDATCTTPETCSVCGLEIGSPLGHTLTETNMVKETSCMEAGVMEGYCSTCGKVLSEDIPLLEHTPGEWVIMEEATYDSAGTKAIVCTACETVLEEELYELTDEEKESLYKKDCKEIPYDDIARNPEQYVGQRVKIIGEVWVCWEENPNENGISEYQISTKRSYGFYSGNDYLVLVKTGSGPRILYGDIITFYGEYEGLSDYYGDYYPKLNVEYYSIK